MNKYLEKIASWKDPSKLMGYVSGKRAREAGEKVRHMEEALAGKTNLKDLKRRKTYEDKETLKARAAAAGTAAGVLGAGAYGYQKYVDHRHAKFRKEYQDLFKTAGLGSAGKTFGKETLGGVGKVLKHVGGVARDIIHTSSGGKVKDYAIRQGLHSDSEAYKKFHKGNNADRLRILLKNKSRTQHSEHHTGSIRNDLNRLSKHQRDARIAAGATGTTGVATYLASKMKRERDEQRGVY